MSVIINDPPIKSQERGALKREFYLDCDFVHEFLMTYQIGHSLHYSLKNLTPVVSTTTSRNSCAFCPVFTSMGNLLESNSSVPRFSGVYFKWANDFIKKAQTGI